MEKKKLEGDYGNLEWKKLAERNLVALKTACKKLHNATKSHETKHSCWTHCLKVLFVGKKVHSVIQFDKMLPKYIKYCNVFLI